MGKFLVEALLAFRAPRFAVGFSRFAGGGSQLVARSLLLALLGLMFMSYGSTVHFNTSDVERQCAQRMSINGYGISDFQFLSADVASSEVVPPSDLQFPISDFPLSHLLHTLPRTARYFTVDKLQQVYLVDEDNAVYKYSPDGKELFYYNNNTRGTLGYIDVTDPFNLLLFYPELQAIATLDRTLNETGVLPLFSAGIVNATAIGLAIDNNVWVYDQANFQLKKVGQDGQVLLASDNLSAQLIQAPQATQLTAQNNMLYLNCPGQGIFVFDNFGQFHQLLPYEKVEEVQLLDGKVVMYEPNQVRVYHLETLQAHTLRDTIPADSILQLRYQGNRYYQLTKAGKVEVYRRP